MKRALLTYGSIPMAECWLANGKVLEADFTTLITGEYTNTYIWDIFIQIGWDELPPKELTIWHKA